MKRELQRKCCVRRVLPDLSAGDGQDQSSVTITLCVLFGELPAIYLAIDVSRQGTFPYLDSNAVRITLRRSERQLVH
jgi:hypothetical protein